MLSHLVGARPIRANIPQPHIHSSTLDHNLEPCTFAAPIRAVAPPLRIHFFCPELNRVFQVFFHERLQQLRRLRRGVRVGSQIRC